MHGYVMQEQPFSVNDGEGIRTTIFFAGCPMKCSWCSNPEGFSCRPLVGYYAQHCIGCGKCAEICPREIGIDLNELASRTRCTGCGKCTFVCPTSARRQLVSFVNAEEIVKAVEKYDMFYRNSGGGVTFSGGEATFQPQFLDALSKIFYDKGYSIDLETCGYFDFDTVKPALERMDLIFMDIKHLDDEIHRRYTGVSNKIILENAKKLADLQADIVIRVPVIGGVNNDENNIRMTASFVKENLPKARIELLPYHKLGQVKYQALGMDPPDSSFFTPDEESLERLRTIVRSEGVKTVSYK